MQQPPDSAEEMSFRQRLIAALVFALLIGLSALWASWSGSVDGYATHGPSDNTQRRMSQLVDSIAKFHAARSALPDDLAALEAWERDSKEQKSPFSWIYKGVVNDGWGHPIIYARTGDNFTVTSLGNDGQPGGVGIDADMVCDPAKSGNTISVPHLTLGQFFALKRGQSQAWTCVIIGSIAGLLCLTLLRGNPSRLIAPGLLTVLGTLIVTYPMGILDIVKWH